MRPFSRVLTRLGLLALFAGLAGCGDNSAVTASDDSSRGSASSLEEAQHAWDDSVLPSLLAVGYSPAIQIEDRRFEVVTISGDEVESWDYDGEQWGRTGDRLTLEFPVAAFEEAVAMPAADLTGDGVDDVVAELYGNDPVGTVLVRSQKGWAAADFVGESYPESLKLQGRDLVSFHKECVPDCARGRAIQRLWKWNGAAFEAPPLPSPPTTTAPRLVPGEPCKLGSDYDCVDPDGDGRGTYFIGGGDCMRTFSDSSGLCEDLDGDGYAGYPDSG